MNALFYRRFQVTVGVGVTAKLGVRSEELGVEENDGVTVGRDGMVVVNCWFVRHDPLFFR
jgi:hypothetical protein